MQDLKNKMQEFIHTINNMRYGGTKENERKSLFSLR
jgi:hypothetical protein